MKEMHLSSLMSVIPSTAESVATLIKFVLVPTMKTTLDTQSYTSCYAQLISLLYPHHSQASDEFGKLLQSKVR